MAESTHNKSLRLPDDIWEQVDAAATRDGKTRNEWLKLVVLSALWSATAYVSPETRRDTEVYE